jgi:hypothetical protein
MLSIEGVEADLIGKLNLALLLLMQQRPLRSVLQ